MKTHLVMKANLLISAFFLSSLASGLPATGNPVFFSTGSPDGLIAAATRPSSAGAFEIETGDDFILANQTKINSATFTGLVPSGSNVGNVVVKSIGYSRLIPMSPYVGSAAFFNPASSYAR